MTQTTNAQGAQQTAPVSNTNAADVKLPVIKKSDGTFTQEKADRIAKARLSYTREMADNKELVSFTLKGNGNLMQVTTKAKDGKPAAPVADRTTGELLTKRLFNIDKNCAVSIESPVGKQLRRMARKYEAQGQKQLASDYWNAWLNHIQISVGIIIQGREDLMQQLGDGVQVNGNLEWAPTEFGDKISIEGRSVKLRKAVAAVKTSFKDDDEDIINDDAPTPNSEEGSIAAGELKDIEA